MIPESVKVGGMVYEVRVVPGPLVVRGRECSGRITYDRQLIELLDEEHTSDQSRAQTLWHEIVHAFTRERGLDWGDNDELYTEELAKALHAFCKDNGLSLGADERPTSTE